MSPIPAGIVASARVGSTLDPYAAVVMADSPLGFWRLNETSGTTALDSSGNGRHGAYSGAFTLGGAGINGPAVAFGSGAGRATVPSGSWMPLSDFTFEGWYCLPPTGSLHAQIARRDDSLIIRKLGGNQEVFNFNSGGGADQLTNSGPAGSPAVSVWYHYVATYAASGTMTFYINAGTPTTRSTTYRSTDPGTPLWLGGNIYGENADGVQFAECAWYPTVLSAARVTAHYNAGIA